MQPMTDTITFQRFGQSHQMRIATVEDLRHILELDGVHFAAISAPVDTFHGDPALFNYLDVDNDRRIRAFEVRHAIEWTLKNHTNPQAVLNGEKQLAITDINRNSSAGGKILQTCEKILDQTQATENRVSLGQIRQVKNETLATNASPAGVVLPDSAADPTVRQFIADIISAFGGAAHPSGKQGITADHLQQFLDTAKAYLHWREQGDLPEGQASTPVRVLGEQTAAAYELYRKLAGKIDQYFALCHAMALDPDCTDALTRVEQQLAEADITDSAAVEAIIAFAPIAPPVAEGVFNLDHSINPAYRELVDALRNQVLKPLTESSTRTLSEQQWRVVKAAFSPYEKWLSDKPVPDLKKLDSEKLQQYLQPHCEQQVLQLIDQTRANAIDLRNLEMAEKLLLFQANLYTFVNNFVAFPELYTPGRNALFDLGSLVMDSRKFNLAVRVNNRDEHIRVAKTSDIFTMYLEITTPGDEANYEVAVAVTWGGQGNICVGKRGIFHDTRGRELDARVVHIIENPISLQEAAVAPFKRIGKLITGKIESLTTAAEKKLDSTTTSTLTQLQQASPAPAPTAATPATGSILAGGGIAIAALGSSLAFITSTLSKLHYSTIIIALVAAIVAVVAPMLIIAWMKLRRRDLSAILEGSGWAINCRMRLTPRLSRYFTQRPIHPAIVKSKLWVLALVAAVLLVAIVFISSISKDEPADSPQPETPSTQTQTLAPATTQPATDQETP